MRRLVVVLIAAALVVVVAGCGGGQKAATPAPAAAPEPAAAPAAVPAVPPVPPLSPKEPAVFEPFPTGSSVPTEVADRISAKEPTLIYFYDGTQYSSKESRKIIDAVLEENRGLVGLVAYDIGKYMLGDASVPVTIDKRFSKDADAQAAVQLARALGVSNTPFLVLTDGQGYIVWKFRGLVDHDFLEREVLRASN
jgi:hypothetical protein